MFQKQLLPAFIVVCGLLVSPTASALQTFLTEWQAFYPDSNSDDIGCQLCHANPGGNAPWNQYGAAVWNVLHALDVLGGGATAENLHEAFRNAESMNVDNDPSGATALAEINNHFQPGWTEGALNTIWELEMVVDPDLVAVPGQVLPPAIPANITTTQIDPTTPTANNLPAISQGNIAIGLETITSALSAPVMAARAPGLPGYLFVVEQAGKIWRIDLSDGSRVLFHDVGTDGLNQLVGLNAGYDERGLLGLAFDPDYANNGFFYTYQSEATGVVAADFNTMPGGQTGNHQSVISEWMTVNPVSIDSFAVSATRRVLMRIEQPESNHNGGMLNFGPDDHLYISLGDGGAADDVGDGHGLNGNGRDNTNPLGSILRINPRGSGSANGEYGVPAGNPFVGIAGLDEIYAYGFRNPYRFSFDSLCFESGQSCNTLITGDVGQNQVEEIDNVTIGGNYGWNWKEGSFFFNAPVPSIHGGGRYISLEPQPGVPVNLIDPIAEYRRSDGRSVTGGYVYRGTALPDLLGYYVFGDFFNELYFIDQNDQIRSFVSTSTIDFIGGFAEDQDKELYVLTRQSFGPTGVDGALQKIVPAEATIDGDELCLPIIASNGSVSVICL